MRRCTGQTHEEAADRQRGQSFSTARLFLSITPSNLCRDGPPALYWSAWYGFFASRGTPKDVIGKINAAAMEALADPAVRSRLADFRLGIVPREQQTPEALDALVKADAKRLWPLIREFGITAE